MPNPSALAEAATGAGNAVAPDRRASADRQGTCRGRPCSGHAPGTRTGSGLAPAPLVQGQSTAADQTVDVEVGTQLLIPGVQHHGDAGRAAQVVAAELEQCLGGGLEEQVQQGALVVLVAQDQGVELVRQREHVVEIGHGQQFCLSCFEPLRLDQRLALGAVAVAAGVVGEAFEAAVCAAVAMAAERCRAATLDGVENAMVGVGQAVCAAIGRAVTSDDVGQFARRLQPCLAPTMTGGEGHGRLGLRLVQLLEPRQTQQIKRTVQLLQMLAGQVQVDGRAAQAAMPHEQLNGAQVHAGFEQVRGKAMPQRVDALPALQAGPAWPRRRCAGAVPRHIAVVRFRFGKEPGGRVDTPSSSGAAPAKAAARAACSDPCVPCLARHE